jgi:hypothetical protein
VGIVFNASGFGGFLGDMLLSIRSFADRVWPRMICGGVKRGYLRCFQVFRISLLLSRAKGEGVKSLEGLLPNSLFISNDSGTRDDMYEFGTGDMRGSVRYAAYMSIVHTSRMTALRRRQISLHGHGRSPFALSLPVLDEISKLLSIPSGVSFWSS